ncbi:phospholipid carrier-dependent glycosyltransferase [bacterium]|nr:MAG: phospholipid carrier-dependent glycosyltransferase [bacterium]
MGRSLLPPTHLPSLPPTAYNPTPTTQVPRYHPGDLAGRSLTLPRAILLAALPLVGWWLTGLFDLDEGFYGAIAAEMNRRGEWVTPYYNGSPWFEKPVLLYWLGKISIGLFGFDFGPRLPAVLSTLATIAIVGVWAEKRLRTGSGPLAALILGSSLLPAALGRMMMTDPPLVLCMTVAFLGYWEALRRPWCLVAVGLALGVGVLAKGPVALLLFVPPVIYLAVVSRERRGILIFLVGSAFGFVAFASIGLGRVVPIWTCVVAFFVLISTSIVLENYGSKLYSERRKIGLAPTTAWVTLIAAIALWYLPAYNVNGQTFVQKFLIEQNLGRFSGGDEAHSLGLASLPLYIPIVLLGMIPWSGWLWNAWRNRADEDRRRGYLWAWAGTVFIFFSISGAKLPHYMLPLFPPLALLVADRLTEKRWAMKLALGMTLFMTVFANVGFYAWYRLSGQQEAHRLVRREDVRKAPEVALYQIGRREAGKGTGGTKILETSLPSVIMYLDRVALDIEEPEGLAELPQGTMVFTRTGRIEKPETYSLQPVEVGVNYVLYRKSR